MNTKDKILIFCEEFNLNFFTGPQKRKFQLYKLLQSQYIVTLAISGDTSNNTLNLNLISIQSIQSLQEYKMIIISPQSFENFKLIDFFTGLIIVDLYIPSIIEHQFIFQDDQKFKVEQLHFDQSLYYKSFSSGDAFLCATSQQKSFYRGMMSAMGILIEEQNILEIPFFAKKSKLIKKQSKVSKIAWIGGFWNWFSPEIFLEKIPLILSKNNQLEIHFVGIKHPFSKFPFNHLAVQRVLQLQKSFPQNIFIHDWLKKQEYQEFLSNIDAVILLSKSKIEEQFSIRTRLFEVLEAKVPIILNSDDQIAQTIDRLNLGIKLSSLNNIDFVAVIEQVLSDSQIRQWDSFFELYSEDNLKVKLLSFFNDVKQLNKKETKNPYLNFSLKSHYRFLWKIKKLKKIGLKKAILKLFTL
ncbi:MAG: hypothetical protein COB02_14915 [Candidatus Cloacimonadota bacterium]|nr:MAG: hypothetical protein COB02_14915 [Candidatus Cloacimonadota bacterium]